MISEQQLIKDCQNGKKSSQYELVKRYSKMLMVVCKRYVRDESTAKDVLQETLIRIFRSIEKYQATGSFEGWMRKIAVRCSLQWLEKNKSRREVQVVDMNIEEPTNPQEYDNLSIEEIVRLIEELPEGYRMVFNLNIIEGYDHKEIAELLNISESSSRSQLVRARRLLQKKINSFNSTKRSRII